jgi:hypothetical protein
MRIERRRTGQSPHQPAVTVMNIVRSEVTLGHYPEGLFVAPVYGYILPGKSNSSRYDMRRFALVALIPAAILLLTASLSARNNQPKYKTIEVKHFTKADGVDLSDVFINAFYDGVRAQLEKEKVADQVVADGAAVPDADAADSRTASCER